jgi:hypothetical protein
MDTRYVFSALIGVFCLFVIFAAITTARHLSQREGPAGGGKTKQSRQAEYDRLTALPGVLPDSVGNVRWLSITHANDGATKLAR